MKSWRTAPQRRPSASAETDPSFIHGWKKRIWWVPHSGNSILCLSLRFNLCLCPNWFCEPAALLGDQGRVCRRLGVRPRSQHQMGELWDFSLPTAHQHRLSSSPGEGSRVGNCPAIVFLWVPHPGCHGPKIRTTPLSTLCKNNSRPGPPPTPPHQQLGGTRIGPGSGAEGGEGAPLGRRLLTSGTRPPCGWRSDHRRDARGPRGSTPCRGGAR